MPATRSGNGNRSLVARLNESAGVGKLVNSQLSLDKYFRSASLLQRQAKQYRLQQNDEQLYVMLLRFVSLVVETIPNHQSFLVDNSTYQRLRKDCLSAIAELERLKMDLELKEKATQSLEQNPFMALKTPGTVPLSAGSVPELHWDTLQPPLGSPAGSFPGEVDFFGMPLTRSSSQQQQQQKQQSLELPSGQQASNAVPGLPSLSNAIKLRPASQATLSKHAILPLLTPQGQQPPRHRTHTAAPAAAPAQRRPLYPEFAPPSPPASSSAAPATSTVEAQLAQLEVEGSMAQQQGGGMQPSPYGELQLGPQEVGVDSVPYPSAPPAPDDTCCTPPAEGMGGQLQVSEGGGRVGVAEVKRRQSIRDVHVSVSLMDEFMRYAISNTKRGIETCGILAGVLSANDATFTITTLIVPRQEGTTDTVQALNEEDIFEAQDSRGLYPLGWIHTHPTQTCFMSSVDVHTHCGYQTMLDEAVAIVMAPRDPSKRVGIFRLSTPGGLKLIQRCPQRGFHTHPPTETGQPVYELCNHVYLNPRVDFEVLDLR